VKLSADVDQIQKKILAAQVQGRVQETAPADVACEVAVAASKGCQQGLIAPESLAGKGSVA